MLLELVVEAPQEFELPLSEEAIHALLEQVLEHEGVQEDCSLSLTLVDDNEMRRLNAQWRGVDAATDVLSFECERPGDSNLPVGVPVELGDIVLAPNYLKRQAAAFGSSLADEWRLMLVHAALHLLGYDHETSVDTVRMQTSEESILAGIPNDGTLNSHVLAKHREEDS